MKTTILHIISKFAGDYPLIDDFLLRLDPTRYRSLVCYLKGFPAKQTRLEAAGIPSFYLGPRDGETPGISPRIVLRLRNIVRQENIDLLHCHRHKPAVYGVLASMLVGGKPIVYTVHGTKRTRNRRGFVNRFLLRRIGKVVAVSAAVRDDILHANGWLCPKQVAVVRNGLDYRRLDNVATVSKMQARQQVKPDDGETFWFGTVGRLAEKKNHGALIRAFAALRQSYPSTRLFIAGSGPLESELRKAIQQRQLDDSIVLLGQRSDIPIFLRALDAFVFPSLPGEGLPLAVLEAMASNLPVLMSNIEAAAEIFGEADCGVRVDPSDEADILRGMLAIRGLDAQARAQMGAAAHARAHNAFSVDRLTTEMTAIYEDVYQEAVRTSR